MASSAAESLRTIASTLKSGRGVWLIACHARGKPKSREAGRKCVLIMLDKKDKIDSHLGLKVRESKRQKDHEMQLGKVAGPV